MTSKVFQNLPFLSFCLCEGVCVKRSSSHSQMTYEESSGIQLSTSINFYRKLHSPINFTFHTLCGNMRKSGVSSADILAQIWPNTDFLPSSPARPPLLRERFTCMRFISITGPCCLSRIMVACTTLRNAASCNKLNLAFYRTEASLKRITWAGNTLKFLRQSLTTMNYLLSMFFLHKILCRNNKSYANMLIMMWKLWWNKSKIIFIYCSSSQQYFLNISNMISQKYDNTFLIIFFLT